MGGEADALMVPPPPHSSLPPCMLASLWPGTSDCGRRSRVLLRAVVMGATAADHRGRGNWIALHVCALQPPSPPFKHMSDAPPLLSRLHALLDNKGKV